MRFLSGVGYAVEGGSGMWMAETWSVSHLCWEPWLHPFFSKHTLSLLLRSGAPGKESAEASPCFL